MIEKIVINDQVCDRLTLDIDKDTSDKYIYEVIRVINGKPLFLKEHYNRLHRSMAISGYSMSFSIEELDGLIAKLFEANGASNDNVKLILDNLDKADGYDVYLYLLHASYPSEEAYTNGVATDLFSATRDNPHVKVRNQGLRDATNAMIEKLDLFEVILVDKNGCITEGSRSNIFFIKDDKAYTSPSEGVLLGVTRQKIIQLCQDNGIDVIEKSIPYDTLDSFDAAFISGTSPKVLPISRIGDLTLDVNQTTLRTIMELFDKEVQKL